MIFRLSGTPGQQETNSRCMRQRQGEDLGVSSAAAILLDGKAEKYALKYFKPMIRSARLVRFVRIDYI